VHYAVKSEENCIFCQIVAKKAPASILYEDADVMAFLDIRPLHMGHSLVISKEHYIDIFDTPPPYSAKFTQSPSRLPCRKTSHRLPGY
jgi:histidine triad (HIT) family protein